jgi:predicted extracellular nuclease
VDAVKTIAVLVAFAGLTVAQTVFINEFHYDNTGTDTGEFIEIAGPAGTDLSGWSIVRYNGATPGAAVVYTTPTADPAGSDTLPPGTVIPNQGGGFGTVVVRYLSNGLQNGPNDGFALVNAAGAVVQLLSYAGVFTAANGPAAGMTSVDVGVVQGSATPVGSSLALCGAGRTPSDFTWTVRNGIADPGAINACQTFLPPTLPTLTLSSVSLAEGNAGFTNFVFNITLSAPAGAGGVSFVANTAPSGSQPATPGDDYVSLVNVAGSIAAGQSTGSVTVQVVGDTIPEPDETFQLTLSGITGATPASVSATGTILNDDGPIPTCGTPGATLISQIQGSGLTSPLVGSIRTIEGIVTGNFQTGGLNGFFVQEEAADQDGDPATSEGIFVNNTSFPVAVGQKVRVTGTVAEVGSPSQTTLTAVTAREVCSVGNPLPAPAPLVLPAADILGLERYEGMRVQLPAGMVVTGNFEAGSFGTVGLGTKRLFGPTETDAPGAAANARALDNTLNFVNLDDGRTLANAALDPKPYPQGGGLDANAPRTLRLGDTVVGRPVGIFEQRFGSYRIHPEGGVAFRFDNPRPAPPAGGPVRVASFNVLNYFTTLGSSNTCGPSGTVSCRGALNAAEFTRQRDKTFEAIDQLDAHIVGLMEIENNGGIALNDLVSGLNIKAGYTKWAAIATGFVGTDSITNAIIYQPTVVAPVGPVKVLDSSVDPDARSDRNRPSLAQTFERLGARADLTRFTVVVNHWKSKGSACNPDDPNLNDGQGNCPMTRVRMAQALLRWLATDPTGSGSPNFLVVGDLNAYSKEQAIGVLTAGGLKHLNAMFAPGGYSYQFQSTSGFLDHMLATFSMDRLVKNFAVWHINADEPAVFQYGLSGKNASQQISLYRADPFASSDHDPLLVTFNPLCGDLDDDGDVDNDDLAIGRAALGKPVASVDRRLDFDGVDATITGRDYSALARCFAAFRAPR